MSGKGIHITLAAVICLALAALAWFCLIVRPEQQAAEEVGRIASELATAITIEDHSPERSRQIREVLEKMEALSDPGRELLLGATAFLDNKPREAEQHFRAALNATPDEPQLLSFHAAANLRLGNTALAAELYNQALTLKRREGEAPVDLSYDQLGLALSLFMLSRPAEAVPLAEEAWQARSAHLGPDAPETLSAATRLATIYVALNEPSKAETLLKEVHSRAGAGGAETTVALEEARLLLTVLYNQSGRQADLKELLDQPLSRAASAGVNGAGTVSVQDAIKAMRPQAVTAEEIAEWDRLADGLAGYNDKLAAELRVRSILGTAALENRDIWSPGQWPLRLELARGWVDSGCFALAGKLLRETGPEIIKRGSAEFIELSSLLAESLEGEGRFEEAENHWRAATEAADARLAASVRDHSNSDPPPADVDLSLRLHLKLAENFLKQNKVAPEAEIELLAALAHLEDVGVKNPADYPAAGRVYLRLAALVQEMSRPDECRVYYGLARAAAEALLNRTSDAQTRRELQKIIDEAAAKSPKNAGVSSEKPTLPEADLLRVELSALAALGRLDEFHFILSPALAEAADRFGPLSLQYMRYYSLKLKWLEESGRVEELTGELTAQADNPPGRNEAERALNRASALIYAAKVNEQAGRPAVAVKLYQKALTGLEGRTEPIMADRRRLIEAALEGLSGNQTNKGLK